MIGYAGAPLATIAICTHDRSEDIRQCLAAIALQAQAVGFPILVVDSGSSPGHAAALRAITTEFDALLVRCDEPGISLARNTAAAHAQGQWVVYIDDDIRALPDWAAALAQCLQAAPDDVAMIGGLIRPRWPAGASPERVGRRWMLLLSCTEREGSGPVPGFDICGGNLAVRRAALQAVGGFPSTLGRVGKRLISGEESFLIERLAQQGLKTRYDDRFGVEHCIPAQRLTVRWATRRAYWEGVSRVLIHKELGRSLPRTMRPLKLAASVPVLLAFAPFSSESAIRCSMAWGGLVGQVRMR